MTAQILTIIGSVLACVIGIWQWRSRKTAFRIKQAEQAKEDLNNANENDDPGSFLDGFGRLRKH